jgi:heme exporter protein B
VVYAKIAAHWLTSGFALVLLTPVIALQYDLAADAVLLLTASLLVGTPVLSLIGSIGAALTIGVRGGGVLLAVLVLPLELPVLIFGVGAADPVRAGAWSEANFSLLGAGLIVALLLCPAATAAALRISAE